MEMEPAASSEPPPSYIEVPKSGGAPPIKSRFSTRQFSQEFRYVRATSSNQGIFVMKACNIICNSICCTICYLIFAAVPVAMIVVGAVHLDDCELQQNIPIFLIVYGSVSLAHMILNLIKQIFCSKSYERGENVQSAPNGCIECIEGLLCIFLFVWFIIGSVWVFSKFDEWKDHKDDSDSPDYCHPVVYLFAFIFLILGYTFLVIICCCGCVLCLLAVTVFTAAAGGNWSMLT